MANLPNHHNRYTGELLASAVEVCSVCHLNFASTKAGDQHRVTRDGARVCAQPSEVGLERTVNSFGAVIYRRPVKAVRAGITDLNSALLSPSKGELLKAS